MLGRAYFSSPSEIRCTLDGLNGLGFSPTAGLGLNGVSVVYSHVLGLQ